jgi:type IV secretion system protein VirB10
MDPEQTPLDPLDPPLEPTGPRAAIHDRRPALRGVLPRQAQTWIMVSLALLILAVILITGRRTPEPVVSLTPVMARPGTIQPAQVRSYQDRLAEQEARLRQEMAPAAPVPLEPASPAVIAPADVDPLVEEQRRRDAQSLFADNVAFSRRAGNEHPSAVAMPPSVVPPSIAAPAGPSPIASPPLPPTAAPPVVNTTGARDTNVGANEPLHTLLEGTAIEAVLVNRLDGTFEGPVQCLVTTPVYSLDRQAVVIPAGARVLGSAAPVQAWGDARLAVRFHRLLMPDGRTYSLDSFTGLNAVGETGLKDQVDRHYLQVFGASLAIGAMSGLAQFGTRGGFEPSVGDATRQSAGASLATSTARVLDRYLNVLPTVTIREGHRIKVVLTNDLRLPSYATARGYGS